LLALTKSTDCPMWLQAACWSWDKTPVLTRQRLVELASKGASLTALAQWPGWEQAKAIVLDVIPAARSDGRAGRGAASSSLHL
jgi:hypothetical protein